MILLLAGIVSVPVVIGVAATLLFGRRPRQQTPVPGLLFHSVLPKPGIEMSHFPLDRFDGLCALLKKKYYTCITVADAATMGTLPEKPALLTFDDGLHTIFEHVLPVLRKYGHRATFFCVAGYYGSSSSWDIYSGNRHLSPEEIAAIAAEGHEIGSHTCTHAYLPYLNDNDVRNELSTSKKQLEDITGKQVTSISFPFGGWNRRVWNIAHQEGYTAATLYRGNLSGNAPHFPVQGVYQFESIADIMEKLDDAVLLSPVRARSKMMTHFSRGTPIWKFRKEYVRAVG